jgi:hypothetical protein
LFCLISPEAYLLTLRNNHANLLNPGSDNFARSSSADRVEKKIKPQTVNHPKNPALAGSGSTDQANPLTFTESDAAGRFIHGCLFF